MKEIELNKYEVDFLTEPFPCSLGDFKDLLIGDYGLKPEDAINESIKSLKKFHKLN